MLFGNCLLVFGAASIHHSPTDLINSLSLSTIKKNKSSVTHQDLGKVIIGVITENFRWCSYQRLCVTWTQVVCWYQCLLLSTSTRLTCSQCQTVVTVPSPPRMKYDRAYVFRLGVGGVSELTVGRFLKYFFILLPRRCSRAAFHLIQGALSRLG